MHQYDGSLHNLGDCRCCVDSAGHYFISVIIVTVIYCDVDIVDCTFILFSTLPLQ